MIGGGINPNPLMMDGGINLLNDEEAQEYTSLVRSPTDGLHYESLEKGDVGNADVEAEAFEAAGEIRIIEPRKYRFTPTARVPTCPLRLMPLDGASVQGTVARSCVVTAVAQKGTWLRVRVGGAGGAKEGWVQSKFSDGTVTLTEVDTYRRHEEWSGSNHFFLGGKVMMGSDVRWFVSSNITLTLPSMVFVWEMYRGFPVRGGGILATVGLVLWAFAMSNLWLTALTDPGIIPRNPSNERAPPPAGEAIGLHGFKFCETCNIFRPPRAKHCQSCDNCVDRFDHHCPWVGSCVAVRNYRFFFAFVGSTVVLIFYMMAGMLARVVLRLAVEGDGSVEKALGVVASGPLDLLMVAMALLVGVPLLRLWWYHVQTILGKGQTTNEDMRGVYRNHHNSYHKGCAQNSISLLCSPAPRSRLPDLSERVYVNDPLSSRGTRNRGRFGGGGGGGGGGGSRTLSWISPAGGFRFMGDPDGDCSEPQQRQQQHEQQSPQPPSPQQQQQQQQARRQPFSAEDSRRTSSVGSFVSARSFTSSMEEGMSGLSGGGAELLSGGEMSGTEQTPAEAMAVAVAVSAALQEKPDDDENIGNDGGIEQGFSMGREEMEVVVEEAEAKEAVARPTLLGIGSGESTSAGFPADSERERRGNEGVESANLGAPEEPPPPPPPTAASLAQHGVTVGSKGGDNGSPLTARHPAGSSTDSSWHGQSGRGSSPLVGLSFANSPRSAMSLSSGGGSTKGAAGAGAADSSHSSGDLSYSPTPPPVAAREETAAAAGAAVAAVAASPVEEPVEVVSEFRDGEESGRFAPLVESGVEAAAGAAAILERGRGLDQRKGSR